jgi:ABC-type uncharacterized transport system ATPase subunit
MIQVKIKNKMRLKINFGALQFAVVINGKGCITMYYVLAGKAC